jgi:uncharacterized membrane protein
MMTNIKEEIEEEISLKEAEIQALTKGEKIADFVSDIVGSWPFIIAQTVIIVFWVTLNIVGYVHKWDPYPFILLNLVFSVQAAYTAPIILMSQNRHDAADRRRAENDYFVNLRAEHDIERLHEKLDIISKSINEIKNR